MSQRSSGSAEPGSDDWPDDLWPDDDDDDGVPGSGPGAAGTQRALPIPPGLPRQRRPGRRLRPLATVALGAALAGAGIALGLQLFPSSPTVPAASGGRPSSLAPGQAGGNLQPGGNFQPGPNGAFPGSGPGAGPSLFMIGKVIAISSRSITIGGPGHAMTAAITGSTRITGSVSSISGIKPGDQVSAQITENGGKATVTAIQDPAQAPAGTGAP
jgi:hypothetical protein